MICGPAGHVRRGVPLKPQPAGGPLSADVGPHAAADPGALLGRGPAGRVGGQARSPLPI